MDRHIPMPVVRSIINIVHLAGATGGGIAFYPRKFPEKPRRFRQLKTVDTGKFQNEVDGMLISKYAQHLTVDVLACVRHFHFRNGIQFFQRGRIRNVFSKHQLHQLGKAAGCRCRGDRTAADQHCCRSQHRRNPSHFPVRSVTSCRHAGCGFFVQRCQHAAADSPPGNSRCPADLRQVFSGKVQVRKDLKQVPFAHNHSPFL